MNENFSSMRDLWSPLAGKRVWIRTPDRVLETTTGADGRFTIDEVPSGTHSVQADLGPEVVASSRFRLASPLDCAQVLVSPEPAGRIVGTLVGRGFPVAGIEVRAVKIQDGVEVTGVWTQRSGRPDANGRFEIHGLKAGQYLLSVNPGAAPTMRQPIPTTHYPGVRERSEAQLVVVEYGTTAVIPPFELTTIMSGRTINAAVSCLDGTRPTEFNLFATRPGDRFHSESSFSSKEPVSRITVLQGVEYDLHATISFQQPDGAGRPPTRTTIKSDIVRIAADETPSLVRLTLPLERCP